MTDDFSYNPTDQLLADIRLAYIAKSKRDRRSLKIEHALNMAEFHSHELNHWLHKLIEIIEPK